MGATVAVWIGVAFHFLGSIITITYIVTSLRNRQQNSEEKLEGLDKRVEQLEEWKEEHRITVHEQFQAIQSFMDQTTILLRELRDKKN